LPTQVCEFPLGSYMGQLINYSKINLFFVSLGYIIASGV
jgi:hypothetical protein